MLSFKSTVKTFTFFSILLFLGLIFSISFPTNANELISNSVDYAKRKENTAYSFLSLISADSRGPNGVDDNESVVDELFNYQENHLSNTFQSNKKLCMYYVTEHENDYAPVALLLNDNTRLPLTVLNTPGIDSTVINYEHLGLDLITSEVQTNETDSLNIYLSFSEAKAIASLQKISLIQDLVGKMFSSTVTMNIIGNQKEISCFISGIFTEDSSSLFEMRYGGFALTTKKDRQLYFGCSQADICEGVGGPISYYTVLTSLDSNLNFDPIKKYYTKSANSFTSSYMDAELSEIKQFQESGKRQLCCVSAGLSLVTCVFLLSIFLKKNNSISKEVWWISSTIPTLILIFFGFLFRYINVFGVQVSPISISTGSFSLLLYFCWMLFGLFPFFDYKKGSKKRNN